MKLQKQDTTFKVRGVVPASELTGRAILRSKGDRSRSLAAEVYTKIEKSFGEEDVVNV